MGTIEHRYLRVSDLRRLRHLLFAGRRPVEGLYAGRHASPQRGHSVEFSDYRPYMPGDEPGDIDWKVYGRSDKLFVKLFEHQSDMTVHLLIDASASMGYSGIGEVRPAQRWFSISLQPPKSHNTKYDHACRMAAGIAFLTCRRQDRVSLSICQEGLKVFHRPQGSPAQLRLLLRAMEDVGPAGVAHLPEAIHGLTSRVRRRGVLVVFSDLLDNTQESLAAMSMFRRRGGEVIVFHVLHPEELNLPELEDAVFIDSETNDRLPVNVRDVREAYADRMRHFTHSTGSEARARGFDYQLVNTAVDYYRVLEQYLFARDRTR